MDDYILLSQGCKKKLFDLVDDNMPLLGGVLGALIGVQVTLTTTDLLAIPCSLI